MALPAPNDVAELFGMLFGTTVEVTEVERDPGTHWLALCMFTTPENEPIAVVGADVAAIAAQGAALAGYPVEDVEEAIDKGRINGDLWENFAEVANVMTGLFIGERYPRCLLHWAKRVGDGEWNQLFAANLPDTTVRVSIEGYGFGAMTFVNLADAPAGSVPLGLDEVRDEDSYLTVPEDGWRPYSFRRPPGVHRDVLRALHVQTVELAKAMAASCNGMLNSPIHQKVLQFHHTTWDDYAAGITNPSLFISFELEPLEGRFLLSWPVELAMVLVDLMLGGAGRPLGRPRTPSALDLGLLERLFTKAIAEVPHLFASFAAVSVTDVRVDLDAKLFQGATFKSSFLAVWMSTEVGGVEHQATLGIPTLAVQPFIDTILGRNHDVVDEVPPALERRLLDVPVEVRVGFRPLSLAATQLATLRPGDVITLDPTTEEPLHMAIGKLELAAVEPVTDGERLLVQVTKEMIERRDDLLRRAARTAQPSPVHEPQLVLSA
jgi:flagellar motor switch protein FliM